MTNTWTVPTRLSDDGTITGNRKTVTFGQRLALVLEWDSTVGDFYLAPITTTSQNQLTGHHHAQYISSAWSMSTTALPNFAIKYSDGTYDVPYGCRAISSASTLLGSGTGIVVDSGTTPDEVGMRFKVPFATELAGASFQLWWGSSTAVFTFNLYDDSNVLLDSTTMWASLRFSSSAENCYLPFPTRPSIAADTWYRITLQPQNTNDLQYWWIEHPTQAIADAAQGGSGTHYLTQRTNAGAWTDTVLRQMGHFDLHFADVNDAASGEIEFGPEPDIALTWVEMLDSDDTLHVWSDLSLPDPDGYYGGRKEARVLRWGTARRSLSDDQGQYEGSEFTWTLADHDREIRGLLADAATKYFPNRPIVVRMITDTDRRALGIARTVFRGLVRDYKPSSPLTFDFTARDFFDARFSPMSEGQQIPKRTITAADFPQCGDAFTFGDDPTATPPILGSTIEIAAADLPVPIIYGAITDTFFVGPDDAGDGQCPAIFVGIQTLSDGDHYKWLVAGHACKSIDEVYINNDPQNIQTDADMSGIGGLWKIPGYDGWTDEFSAAPYEDISGRRYCVVYGKRGPDVAIVSSTVANPTVIEATAHGLVDGPSFGLTSSSFMEVTIIGHAGSEPDINGTHIVTVTDANHFTIPVAVTVGGTGGRVLQFLGPDIAAGVAPARDENVVPFALSVQGIEDVGDGSGDLIVDAFAQYLHAMQNWIIGDYQSGAWLATPMFPDDSGLPIIDEDSFDAASDVAWSRVSGGYRGDFIIGFGGTGVGGQRVGGERITARDLVAQFNRSFDVNSGFNRKTQFFVSMLDDSGADVSSSTQITDINGVIRDSLDITDDVQRLWNQIPYRHTRDYCGRMGTTNPQQIKGQTDAQWRSLQVAASIQDDPSILNYSHDPANTTPFLAPILTLFMVRGQNRATDASDYAQGEITWTDVVGRFLARHKDPPRIVRFQTGLAGMNLDLGDLIRLTHFAGIGSSGWTDRPLRIIRHEAEPGARRVTIYAQDLQTILDEA